MPRAKTFLDGKLRAQRASDEGRSRMVALRTGPLTTRRRGRERTPATLSQFAGVRLMTLGDGVERGIRMLEFRTGVGPALHRAGRPGDRHRRLRVQRARPSAGTRPTGFRHPGPARIRGRGRARLAALVLRPARHLRARPYPGHERGCRPDYNYPRRKTVRHSLHGRIGTIPARLTGYGESWEATHCVLWAEGVVQQSTVFGEDLHLHPPDRGRCRRQRDPHQRPGGEPASTGRRTCSSTTSTSAIRCSTRARAISRRSAMWSGPRIAGAAIGRRASATDHCPPPQPSFHEQVWEHDIAADAAGEVPVALVNDRLGLGFEVATRKDQFPCLYEWQNFQAGHYALGIEPSTHHVLGNNAARERGEMIWLEHGEERPLCPVTIRVLPTRSRSLPRPVASPRPPCSRPSPIPPAGPLPAPRRTCEAGTRAARRTEDETRGHRHDR